MKSLKVILFLSAGLLIAATPSHSAKKNKNKISKSCLNCLNSFSAETLNFPKKIRGKCTKILSSCDKTDRTADCEKVINECFEYNCSATGSCSDAKSNRALIVGCLSAENKFLPYQCRNYVKGKASSFAEQAKASVEQEKLKQQAEIETAKVEAEKAKTATEQAAQEAKIKQAQIEAEAKTKQAQIEAENKIKLEEKKKQLELQAVRDQKKEKINSNPNVKYNKALSNVRKAISQAKKESNSVFAQMGIQEMEMSYCNDSDKIKLIFPPKYIPMLAIENTDLDSNEKAMLLRSSKYSIKTNDEQPGNLCFVCNKDIKESIVKSKLDNIATILSNANETLANDITEIENANMDETSTQFLDEDKFGILNNIQNNIDAALKQIQTHINTLSTSCETRCKGINPMTFKKSSGIEFDEKGNIIEDKVDENTGYSCPDLQQTKTDNNENKSPFDMSNMMSFMTGAKQIPDTETEAQKKEREKKEKQTQNKSLAKMMGGINYQAMEITERTTKAVLEVDKTLDQINIIAKLNRIIGIGSFAGGSYSGKSKFCSTINPTEFAECMYPQFKEDADNFEAKQSSYLKERLIEKIKKITSLALFNNIPECANITKETKDDNIIKCNRAIGPKLLEEAKKANNNYLNMNNLKFDDEDTKQFLQYKFIKGVFK